MSYHSSAVNVPLSGALANVPLGTGSDATKSVNAAGCEPHG
jgi:hypothetical protein